MGWVNDAIAELASGRATQVQPFGGSMRGRIESGQLVTLCPVDSHTLKPGDVVLVRWQGNYLLHLIRDADADRLLIGNNLGKVNGWVPRADVVGVVTDVVDEPTANATVVKHVSNSAFLVRIDDGTEVHAEVRKHSVRDMYRIVPGDRVSLAGLWNKKYRITGFAQPSSRE